MDQAPPVWHADALEIWISVEKAGGKSPEGSS